MVQRVLNLTKKLPDSQSVFLFGPRGTGKTSLSKSWLAGLRSTIEYDLLEGDTFTRYAASPGLFRKEIEEDLQKKQERLTVFVDEIQKLPLLLDEIHLLIEKYKKRIRFLLTGSSARKLRREGANMLAGRAWEFRLHPLTHSECDIDLQRALQFGTLPGIYLSDTDRRLTLKAYVNTYLKEEIMQEALVRKVESYIRFLDVAAQMNGEPLNFSKMAGEAHVSPHTAQEYFSILVDTLLAFRIEGWTYSVRKQIKQGPKFYFFDPGVLNTIRGEIGAELKPNTYRYGKLFEMWIVLELIRMNDYRNEDFRFYYWRTNTGLEVDLILSRGPADKPIAIEIKSSEKPQFKDLHALKSFQSENKNSTLICLCNSPRPYKIENVRILPWKMGIEEIFS